MGIDPAATAFIVVSLRKWDESDRQDWLTRRNKEGVWRTVVALYADDLDGWLDEAPAVRVWVSEQMGRRPRDVATLDLWWQHWAGATRPALPADLLVAGRRPQAEELGKLLTEARAAHGVVGPSRDEALAFVAAALLPRSAAPPEGDLAPPVLVVAYADEWGRLVDGTVPTALVPAFPSTTSDVAAAVRAGHHVIIPMGLDEDPARAAIVLPRIARDAEHVGAVAAIVSQHLEEALTRRFGVEWVARDDGHGFEIKGIGGEMMRLFSSRRASITADLRARAAQFEQRYGRKPSQREMAHLAQASNFKTRTAKEGALDLAELHKGWADKLARARVARVIPARSPASSSSARRRRKRSRWRSGGPWCASPAAPPPAPGT